MWGCQKRAATSKCYLSFDLSDAKILLGKAKDRVLRDYYLLRPAVA